LQKRHIQPGRLYALFLLSIHIYEECALFNAVGLPFEHNWLSEGESKARAAKYFFEGEKEYKTPAWEEQDADEKIYRRLHFLLWGNGPESGNGGGEADAQMA
jgi:hypothetical protein